LVNVFNICAGRGVRLLLYEGFGRGSKNYDDIILGGEGWGLIAQK
jgi:hypothetical protein